MYRFENLRQLSGSTDYILYGSLKQAVGGKKMREVAAGEEVANNHNIIHENDNLLYHGYLRVSLIKTHHLCQILQDFRSFLLRHCPLL